MPDLRDSIQSSLAAVAAKPLRVAANGLLETLGYSSDKTIDLGKSDPKTFLDLSVSGRRVLKPRIDVNAHE